jgi:hypothetical protein
VVFVVPEQEHSSEFSITMFQPRLINVHTGEQLALAKGELVVGRGAECDIVIDNRSVSTRHAILHILQDGRCLVRDLGSTNGTRIKDGPIGEGFASPNDPIEFGAEKFIFQNAPDRKWLNGAVERWAGFSRNVKVAVLCGLATLLGGIALVLVSKDSLSEEKMEDLLCSQFQTEAVEFSSAELADASVETAPASSLDQLFDKELKLLMHEGALGGSKPVTENSESPMYRARKLFPIASGGVVGECIYDTAYWNPYTVARKYGVVVNVEKIDNEVSVADIKRSDGTQFRREVRTDGWHKMQLFGMAPSAVRFHQRLIDTKNGNGDVAFQILYTPTQYAKKWIAIANGNPFVTNKFAQKFGPTYWAHLRRFDDGWKVVSIRRVESGQ